MAELKTISMEMLLEIADDCFSQGIHADNVKETCTKIAEKYGYFAIETKTTESDKVPIAGGMSTIEFPVKSELVEQHIGTFQSQPEAREEGKGRHLDEAHALALKAWRTKFPMGFLKPDDPFVREIRSALSRLAAKEDGWDRKKLQIHNMPTAAALAQSQPEAVTKHTDEEDFQHFLSYSGYRLSENLDTIEKLRVAFMAGCPIAIAPTQPGAREEDIAREIYEYVDSKVCAWMRDADGEPIRGLRQSIIDWISYKLSRHAASKDEGKIKAFHKVGFWLSAALDDPKVAPEFKDAINELFEAFGDYFGLALPAAPATSEKPEEK